jgi:lysylphosphatidylglycerol synthetase-like protein (DUF2156 family)
LSKSETAKWFAAALGVVLLLVGVLGFIDNPIVGHPDNNPIFVADTMHNIVHLATGALALYIAFGLRGLQRANGLIAFGVLYGVVLLATVVSPNLFGLMAHPVNTADHVLHLLLTAAPILVGWWARTDDDRVEARTR